ncbi:Polypeptide N-acetylgalactosaminyltransferase 10 [Symbiodinium microadriaticum]|uniref:Polypeptide N-acetylgalactosaminyltransferase 10 n=1 Tax=Symbiodinium microadriaticum TaxID=2951 RepID=A0A1Q9F5Q6_SYMMI|nr:Polypeptide N-acetylgalactosaminyltransferase 10 [Symbiodinium microadriaticum]
MKKSTSSCLQRVVFLWLLFLVATLFFAHQWLLPRTLEPSAKIEAAQPQTENRALAALQAPEPVDSHGGGQSGQPHLSKTNLDKEEEAEPAPVEASEARGGRSRQASFEAPLTDFDNNAPRPPPRPGDYEEYSEAPETLPGIDANHLHGRLGLRADGTPKAPAIPLPPNGLTDEERSDAHRGFCFNSRVSDSISVDRSQDDIRSGACRKLAAGYPTSLPQATIVIVFHNEAFSALVRSVHSVLNTSPPHLVKEVILVDDASHPDDLRFYRKHWKSEIVALSFFHAMAMTLGLVLVLGSLCRALSSSWYLVDVPLAVCEEPYTASTLIPLNIALPGRSDQPHILTVYRTGNKQLSFTVSVLDSKSKDVTSAEVKLDGQSIPSSEVTATATTTTFTTTTATLPILNMTIEATLKTEDEEFVRLLRRKPGRALSGKGGGRSYGGGYSGGRRGCSGYSSYTDETLAGELHMTTAGELHTTTAVELHMTTAVELLFLIAEEEHRRARGAHW